MQKGAIEYMMMGASVVQVGTAVMTEGRGIIGEILAQMENWLYTHGAFLDR